MLIACTEGQRVRFTLTLTQGHTSGAGRGAGHCTGESSLTAYPVTVKVRGDGEFVEGPATACATAVNLHRGRVVDTKDWCRAGGVTLVGDGDRDDEEADD